MRSEVLACAVVIAVVVVACAACGGDSSAPMTAAVECRPFEIAAEIEWGTVIAAGRSNGGTLYVVDEGDDGELRAFVGSETSLTRVSVAGGSSSNGAGLRRDTLTIEAQPRGYTLIVERSATTVRMARTLDGERGAAIDDLPASAHLEPVEPSAFDGAELHDLPSEIAIEYLAQRPEGELVLIIHPDQPGGIDYDSFRLFYGREDRLVEREVVSVTRARDGGSTHVIFMLDGAMADAFFPIEHSEDGFQPGPATLEHQGDVVPLERLDPAANTELLAGTRFDCLE